MKQIVEEMERLVVRGEYFALATVIARNGSAPRSAGAKMLITCGGTMVGSIGGGILEVQVRNLAAQMINERCAIIQSFNFNGEDAATMDAICGGEVDVLVEWVDVTDPQTKAIIQGLHTAIMQHRKAWLVTVLPDGERSTAHSVIQPDRTFLGTFPIGINLDSIIDTQLPRKIEFNKHHIMIEPVNIAGTAYIFGAGHVARSLAEFAKVVGFWTVVLDDREEYANRERFSGVDELIILNSYSDLLGKISIDRDSYIVIVTRGHLNDLAVLAQVLKFDSGYIGMIGSRRKCELVFHELRQMGFQDEDIRRLHAPIGLPIAAETPEEIGISIIAEMIRVRAQNRNTE